jgi:predicted GNAT superfamily acetyltransferase
MANLASDTRGDGDISYRLSQPQDLENMLMLNQANVPAVGILELSALEKLITNAKVSICATVNENLAGFIIAYAPKADYQSSNYQWFENHYDKHLYIDRIAVDGQYRKLGIGKGLYEQLALHLDGLERMTCEVNLDPPNPVSMAFHQTLDFRLVGEQVPSYDYVKKVAMLCKECN